VSAVPVGERQPAGWHADAEWAEIAAAAPRVAAVMRRYLRQLGTFLAPRSVDAAENALRQIARWMITDAGLVTVGDIRRDDIEDYKVWLAGRPRPGGQTITRETHRQRMRTVRQFFERIIEWDWPDAPARNPVIAGDIPKKPEPLPKFLDDRDAAKLMAAARASTDPRDRLVVELLARTGMRALTTNAPDHPPHRRRGRARRDAHLPGQLAVRQPEAGPGRQPRRVRRPGRAYGKPSRSACRPGATPPGRWSDEVSHRINDEVSADVCRGTMSGRPGSTLCCPGRWVAARPGRRASRCLRTRARAVARRRAAPIAGTVRVVVSAAIRPPGSRGHRRRMYAVAGPGLLRRVWVLGWFGDGGAQ
jgi:hypothetical protein